MFQITSNLVIEFTALIIALMYNSQLKKSKLKTLPYFLLFICIVESIGNMSKSIPGNYNSILYNISTPIEYSYYLYLFSIHLRNNQLARSFIFFLWLISLVYFIIQPITSFHYNVLFVGSIEVVVLCCLYIYEQFIDEVVEVVLYKNYFFWTIAGLLLFNIGEATFFGFFKFMNKEKMKIFGPLFSAINNNLLLVLYFCWIISIIIISKFNKPVYAK